MGTPSFCPLRISHMLSSSSQSFPFPNRRKPSRTRSWLWTYLGVGSRHGRTRSRSTPTRCSGPTRGTSSTRRTPRSTSSTEIRGWNCQIQISPTIYRIYQLQLTSVKMTQLKRFLLTVTLTWNPRAENVGRSSPKAVWSEFALSKHHFLFIFHCSRADRGH